MSPLKQPESSKSRIVALPGDGVGPEVMAAGLEVLAAVDAVFGLGIEVERRAFGGAAIDEVGEPLPQATLEACRGADAVLLGAIGGPQWEQLEPELRPERGLLRLRSELGLFCNLRPVATHPALAGFSPLRASRLEGVDMVLVRELTGGIYFGDKRRVGDEAVDVCSYTRSEIERITRKAADLARNRRGKLTLVDKANVLETSRLWREVVGEIVSADYPDLEYETLLVDAAAMHLLSRPSDFDVMLTENLFGDILSDEASMLCGSMGLLPSASLAEGSFGVYEPIHGSAPDIAGSNSANPAGMLLSVALMLRHSLGREDAAQAIEQSIFSCWEAGVLTREMDPAGPGTKEFARKVCEVIEKQAEQHVPRSGTGG